MHRSILGASLLTLCALAGASAAQAPVPQAAPVPDMPTAAACPPTRAPVLERFTPADCVDCWTAPDTAAPGSGWLFDWITPAGADAPMSAAAPVESGERARRAGLAPTAAAQPQVLRSARSAATGLRLSVQSGPAWNGYFGLQFIAQGQAPAGATGWLALVERLPAGTEGSTVARTLVRTVAGPLPLDAMGPSRRISHLSALRWPESARPERLQARAWVEAADGRLLAVAADRCTAK